MRIKNGFVLWLAVVIWFVTGCATETPPPTSSQPGTGPLIPTFTNAAATRQTQQAQEGVTLTSTETEPVHITAPTSIPTAIPTATNAAASHPSPAPTTISQPTIHSFTGELSDHSNGTDKMVTFHWQTSGADTVRINDYVYGYSRFVPGWNVGASGTMTITLDATLNRNLYYELIAYTPSDYGTVQQQGVTIAWPCEYSYFFTQPEYLAACAVDEAVYSAAAEQHFEHGRMIWLEAPYHPLFNPQPTILVIYDSSAYPQDSWQSYFDLWTPDHPVDDPTLTPPTGLYQPVRGFGEVWRNNPEVWERLGWAITPELSYAAALQSAPYEPEYAFFLSLSDGLVLWLGRASYDGSPYWQWLEQ